MKNQTETWATPRLLRYFKACRERLMQFRRLNDYVDGEYFPPLSLASKQQLAELTAEYERVKTQLDQREHVQQRSAPEIN